MYKWTRLQGHTVSILMGNSIAKNFHVKKLYGLFILLLYIYNIIKKIPVVLESIFLHTKNYDYIIYFNKSACSNTQSYT